jgi:hypothetical protein
VVHALVDTDDFTVVASSRDTTVIAARDAGRPVIVKIASTPAGALRLDSEADKLTRLHRLTTLGTWRGLVPVVAGQGSSEGHQWWSQSGVDGVATLGTARPGTNSATASAEPCHLAELTRLAHRAITTLHRGTAHHIGTTDSTADAPTHDATMNTTDDAVGDAIDRIVWRPFETIANARPTRRSSLDAIGQTITSQISATSPTLCWVHGDLAPDNVLFSDDGTRVTGIVDWELAAESLPPEIDLAHFVIALVAESQRIEYGRVVAALLDGNRAVVPDWAHDRLAATMPNRWSPQTSATIAWAHHVSANLAKAPHYRTNELWLGANIDVVVDALETLAGVEAATTTALAPS